MSRAWRPDKESDRAPGRGPDRGNNSKKRILEERTEQTPRETDKEPPAHLENPQPEEKKETTLTKGPGSGDTELPAQGDAKSADRRWIPGRKKEGSENTGSTGGGFGSAASAAPTNSPVSEQPEHHSETGNTGGDEEKTQEIPVTRRSTSESTEEAGKKAESDGEETASFGTTMIKKVLHRQSSTEGDGGSSPESPYTGYSESGRDPADSSATESPETDTGGGFFSSISRRLRRQGPLSPQQEAQDKEEQETRLGKPPVEPGGSMDPNERVRRIRHDIQTGDHEPATASEEEDDAREGLVEKGPFLWMLNHWILIAVPLLLVCIGAFVFATLYTQESSDDELASQDGGAGEQHGGAGGEPVPGEGDPPAVPLYESGLAFEYSETDGAVELTAGDISWTGEVATTSESEGPTETVTLSGPTAAKIIRGYQMGDESGDNEEVATMTYAVEVEDAPDFYATSQQFSGTDTNGGTLGANGSYTVTEDSGTLIAEGNYSDKRTGNGNEVIRTYTETVPGREESDEFRVRYEAPAEAPIPALVGWQEPQARQAAAEEGQG